MKKIFGAFGSIAMSIIALLLLGLAFAMIPKLLAKSDRNLSNIPSSSNPYPLPEISQGTTPTSPALSYSYPAPAATEEATPTFLAVDPESSGFAPGPRVAPLTPHPPDFWPTDEPWPPLTATPVPYVTLAVVPFPTPEIVYLDGNVSDENLGGFWYAERQGKNAKLKLFELGIDAKGKRKEKPKAEIPLGFGSRAEKPRVSFAQITMDGKYIAYEASEREGATLHIWDRTNGKQLSTEEKYSFSLIEFYRWSPDGKAFLAHIDTDNSISSAWVVNIQNGKKAQLVIPDLDGVSPNIDDMAYSPDGRKIAAASSYQPASGKNNPWMTEITTWSEADLSSLEVVCRFVKGKDIYPNTLKWSPDGKKLLWVGGLENPGVEDWENWLWLADLNTKSCESVINMGVAPTSGFGVTGGFSADWSPDSSEIAYRMKEETLEGSVYRISVRTFLQEAAGMWPAQLQKSSPMSSFPHLAA